MTEDEYNDLTERVIGVAIAVHRKLGPGKPEAMYEEAMHKTLLRQGIACERQVPLPLVFDGEMLDCGYRMDLIVEGVLVIELKTVTALLPIHEAQLLTYLRLSGHKVGLLINFEVMMLKDGIKRRVNGLGKELAPHEPWQTSTMVAGPIGEVIHCALGVHSKLGPGLLRSTYITAMIHLVKKHFRHGDQTFARVHQNLQRSISMDGLDLEHPLEIELALEFPSGSWLPLLILSVDEISPLHEARFRSQIRLAGWERGFIFNFNAVRLKDGLRQIGLTRRDSGPHHLI
ncbi:MAG: GxxExxY protein [Verrucomicrobiaceae bacterium]|nr:GxxExxY protein [Verrucomicrobiaceae bacterium]